MPELSVTEEQLERIEALRAELETTFVDGYGHVRRRDAVDYLLDTRTPPAEHAGSGSGAADRSEDPSAVERRVRDALDRAVRDEDGELDYPALQSVATETEGVKGSGMDAEAMYEAVLGAKLREAETSGVDAVEIPTTGEESPDGSAENDGAEASESEANGGDGIENETGTVAERAPTSGNGSGGSQLQQMMSLLETHDDKWRKTDGGDAPYEVDLPDGGTGTARTKDDVKRILFTSY